MCRSPRAPRSPCSPARRPGSPPRPTPSSRGPVLHTSPSRATAPRPAPRTPRSAHPTPTRHPVRQPSRVLRTPPAPRAPALRSALLPSLKTVPPPALCCLGVRAAVPGVGQASAQVDGVESGHDAAEVCAGAGRKSAQCEVEGVACVEGAAAGAVEVFGRRFAFGAPEVSAVGVDGVGDCVGPQVFVLAFEASDGGAGERGDVGDSANGCGAAGCWPGGAEFVWAPTRHCPFCTRRCSWSWA